MSYIPYYNKLYDNRVFTFQLYLFAPPIKKNLQSSDLY